jgi:nuclear pore complex protein Nup98-Nup96
MTFYVRLLWENPGPQLHRTLICISDMVRFTAYNSDSGSNTSDNEDDQTTSREPPRATGIVEPDPNAETDVDDAPSSSSSSSSEMQEEALRSSPASPPVRRKISRKQDRNALVEDENGDIHIAHVHVSPVSSNSSPPAKTRLNNPRDDPTIIPWAKHVGVDAQTMHVMQTSLFRMPEEAAALKALQQVPKPMTAVRLDISARNQTVNRKHSRDSDGDGLRIDSREVGLFYHAPCCSLKYLIKARLICAQRESTCLSSYSQICPRRD